MLQNSAFSFETSEIIYPTSGFGNFKVVTVGYGIKKLAAQTLAEKAPKIAERLIRIFDDPGDAYRWYNSMKKANFADDLIADMADMLGRDARSKLGNLAAKGMSSELLEMLARNADLLEKFSLTDLLAFKNAASKADDIVRLLSKRGRGFVNLYRAYGDDAVTVALKLGDGALDDLQKYGLELIGLVRTKGDDFARLYQKYGSEFVAKCLRYGDDVFVNAAKYGDDYIELLMRYGDDVMEGLRLHGDDFMEQYRKRGDEFIDDFLKRGDEALKGGLDTKKNDLVNKIKGIRGRMPNTDLAKRGNMAVADVNILGVKDNFVAHSKINMEMDKGADVADFSYLKPESERIFTTYVEDQYPRYHDTEAKILEDIASQISDPNVSGTIDLYSEQACCQSCSNIIFEFRSMFPNITLNIFVE